MNVKKALNWCKWCSSEKGDRQCCPFEYACEQDNWIETLERLNESDHYIKQRKKNGEKGFLRVPEQANQEENESGAPWDFKFPDPK